MRGLLLLLLWASVLLASPAQARIAQSPPENAGLLVYSVSSLSIAMNFSFSYRRVATAQGEPVSDQNGLIECRCVGFWRSGMANPDFSGRETGKVFIKHLAAGDYSIYDFDFGGAVGGAAFFVSSSAHFSFPFTIRPGEVTYVGNFARAPSLGTSLEPQLGAAGFFVVSDKSTRDLQIARLKQSLPADVSVQVTNVSLFESPVFRTAEP